MKNKGSRRAKLSFALIVIFTVALLALIGMATWRNNAATRLEAAVSDLGRQNHVVNLADSSREKFFSVGNTFRLYTATGEEKYKKEYIKGLLELKEMLTLLEKQMGKESKGTSSLKSLLEKKALETNLFLRLKTINDSLIKATVKLKNIEPIISPVFKPLTPAEVKVFTERTATVENQKSDRKLFGRINREVNI